MILGETVCDPSHKTLGASKCSEAIEKTALAELQFVKKVCDPSRKTLAAMGRVPPPPGILHDYQKKWVTGGGFCMIIKTKGI